MAEASILEYSSDISKAEAPLPLPAREYDGTIETVELRTSQTSGRDYLSAGIRIPRESFPADFDDDAENMMYPDGVVLSYNRIPVEDNPRARYQMRKWCESIGAKASKQIDPNDWIGLSVKVGVVHQEYEGEQRASIGKVARG